MENNILNNENELKALCGSVREFVGQRKYHECEQLISEAIGKYPHSPEPHNLFGILLENMGDHLTAMKHFRAAWDLDPAYIPARFNLDRYSSFFPVGQSAFDETDCPIDQKKDLYKIEYDEFGIGHIVKRK